MSPRVSVVMSVYNGEKYLQESVESILDQTWRDFEFIVLDDGSSDSTPRLLADYAARDPRLIIHRFASNQGLASALNVGIRQAGGEYIARMDADDVSLPKRLEEQIRFLDRNPEVGVCSTGAETIGEKQNKYWLELTSHDTIHARMLFVNAIAHPTVMLRTSMLRKHALEYDTKVRYAQDYELWSRAILKTRFANLPQVLLKYRMHSSQVGVKHLDQQLSMFNRIYRQFFAPLGLDCSEGELVLHQGMAFGNYAADARFLRKAKNWLEKILRANRQLHLITPAVLEKELATRWDFACHRYEGHSLPLMRAVLTSPLRFENKTGISKLIRLLQFLTGNP